MMKQHLAIMGVNRSALMGIAIILVMAYHIPVSNNIPVLSTIADLGYAGVDFFLFLSGYGLYFAMSKKGNTLPSYYKRRFSRILPEYWLILLIPLVHYILSDNRKDEIIDVIYCATTFGYWIDKPFRLWYVSCIVVFYALFPFYFKMFKKKGMVAPIIAIGIGVLLMGVYALVFSTGNGAYFNEELIFSFARIPIFILGSIFGHWAKDGVEIELTPIKKGIAIAATTLSIIFLVVTKDMPEEYMSVYSLHYIPLIIAVPTLCILIPQLLEKLPQMMVKSISYIGTISYELYLVHENIYYKVFHNNFISNHINNQALTTAIAIIVSLIFGICLFYLNKKVIQPLICKNNA